MTRFVVPEGIRMPRWRASWAGNSNISTRVVLKGIWVIGRTKSHMVYSARAAWDTGRPLLRVTARCGDLMSTPVVAMHPDPALDPCDGCLLADYRPETVYRLFDSAGELLYIGYTYNPIERIKAHRRNPHWGTHIADVRLEFFESETAARTGEIRAIKAEKPLHNVQFLHRYPNRRRARTGLVHAVV